MALSQDRITKKLGVPVGGIIPPIYPAYRGVADNVLIYAGAMVAIDTSNYVRPARSGTSSDIIIGCARKRYDNTAVGHAAGLGLFPQGVEIEVAVCGWDNDSGGSPVLASTAFGTAVYALDDHTITLTAGSNSKAGRLWGLGSDGFVYVIPEAISWA